MRHSVNQPQLRSNLRANRGSGPGSVLCLPARCSRLYQRERTAHAQPVSFQNLQWGSCRHSRSILRSPLPRWGTRALLPPPRGPWRERQWSCARISALSPLCVIPLPTRGGRSFLGGRREWGPAGSRRVASLRPQRERWPRRGLFLAGAEASRVARLGPW